MRLPRAILAAALVAALPPRVGALTVEEASLDALVTEADAIVHGEVVRAAPEPVPERPWASRTRVLVLVWETVASRDGRPLGLVEMVLPGGTRNGIRTVAPGVPQVAPGDEVLLLLERRGTSWLPIGYRLGLLRVGRDAPPWLPDHVADLARVLR